MSNPFETPDPLKKHSGDVDLSWDSLHHTLGGGPTQAAPGKHKHKLKDIEDYVPAATKEYVDGRIAELRAELLGETSDAEE